MEKKMPKDPAILLSYVNTMLRDKYDSLEEMCKTEAVDKDDIAKKLSTIGYDYDLIQNQFI